MKRTIALSSPALILAVVLLVFPSGLFAQRQRDTPRDFNKCEVCGGELSLTGKPGGCRCTSDTDCQSAMNALLREMGSRDSIGGYTRKQLDGYQKVNGCAFLKTLAGLYANWRDKDERRRDAEDAARRAKEKADAAARKAKEDADSNAAKNINARTDDARQNSTVRQFGFKSPNDQGQALRNADPAALKTKADELEKEADELEAKANKARRNGDYATANALSRQAAELRSQARQLRSLAARAKREQASTPARPDSPISGGGNGRGESPRTSGPRRNSNPQPEFPGSDEKPNADGAAREESKNAGVESGVEQKQDRQVDSGMSEKPRKAGRGNGSGDTPGAASPELADRKIEDNRKIQREHNLEIDIQEVYKSVQKGSDSKVFRPQLPTGFNGSGTSGAIINERTTAILLSEDRSFFLEKKTFTVKGSEAPIDFSYVYKIPLPPATRDWSAEKLFKNWEPLRTAAMVSAGAPEPEMDLSAGNFGKPEDWAHPAAVQVPKLGDYVNAVGEYAVQNFKDMTSKSPSPDVWNAPVYFGGNRVPPSWLGYSSRMDVIPRDTYDSRPAPAPAPKSTEPKNLLSRDLFGK